jgi:putative ABC transport system substrate-binding protein
MMRRREASAWAAAGWAAGVLGAHAAAPPRIARIGTLLLDADLSFLRQSLQEIGYAEGTNVVFVARPLDVPQAELDASARELVAAGVDVIVSGPAAATQAVRRATTTIPIVMFYAHAPVEMGLVASLARPGGNVTGTIAAPLELAAKAIELLRDSLPRFRRVVVLAGVDDWSRLYLRETERAARALAVAHGSMQIDSAAELDSAFAALEHEPPDGIAVGIGVIPYYDRIVRFAAARRLPAIYAVIPAVTRHGGLMAYSTNYPALMTRTAAIVDRVLRGAQPADIPVEEPTRYVLAINQRTARALGLTIPRAVLVRADVVVE